MTADDIREVQAAIRAIRAALGEDTATFGRRFCRSGRTVEDWEQGRRVPDPLCRRDLIVLAASLAVSENKTLT
jgi:DNA-binding transcriptional regulator YiaG